MERIGISHIGKLKKYGRIILTLSLTVGATQGSSGALDSYTQTIKNDNTNRANRFSEAGTLDLSNQGYSACTVSSECLSGVQTCVAGTKPNTPQLPGYCVETETE